MTLLVGMVAVLAGLAGTGAATRVDAGIARMPSCYPANEFVGPDNYFVPITGVSDAEGAGAATFTESELGLTPTDPGSDNGGGSVKWAVRGSVTATQPIVGPIQRTLSGNLSLQVTFANSTTPMIFKTKCAAEVQSEPDSIEMEFEGTVTGFPGDINAQNAVVSMSMSKGGDPHFSVELGSTCFESTKEIGFTGKADSTAYLRIKNNATNWTGDVGRSGFPAGYGPFPLLSCDGAY